MTRSARGSMTMALLLTAAPLVLPACRAGREQETHGIKVAATIQPLAAITREILGDRGTVAALLPPGASPHTFEPLPGDLARLSGTRLVVRVGVGIDQWSERLLAAAGSPPSTLTFLNLPDAHPRRWEHGETPAHAVPGDAGFDPHLWLDPTRVRDALVPAIADALTSVDPAGAEAYRERARIFAGRLSDLDAEIRELLRGTKTRAFIAYHDTWRYFAERYDLDQIGSIEAYAGDEPTAAELARLVALARDRGVAAIVMEPQLGERVARNIADELGATLVVADPLGDPSDPDRIDYVKTMQFNARAFARALGGAAP